VVTMVRWGVRCVVVWRTYLSSSNSLDSALLPLSDLSSSELVNRKLVSLTLSLSHLQQYGKEWESDWRTRCASTTQSMLTHLNFFVGRQGARRKITL
jgi:hypothetical protein